MNLDQYGPAHIESFLLSYELLVKDLSEMAANWSDLDDEERSQYRADLMQTWGNRKALGSLLRARRLSQAQTDALGELDRLLLEQAPLMAQCYGLDLPQLLVIFRWGTPLANSTRPVRLELAPASLSSLATALAPAPGR